MDKIILGTPYDENDAAEETDVSKSEVSETWHQARDDAQRSDDEKTDDWKRKK